MDDPLGLQGMAAEDLAKAAKHQGLSVCMNPLHDHATSNPCDDDCLDHIHQCDQGCGGWPCDVAKLGQAVANLLAQVQATEAAFHHFMHELGPAIGDLENALEQEIFDNE